MLRSFTKLLARVSVLGAGALALLVEGAKSGWTAAIAGGAMLAIPALVGIVALARIMVLTEGQGRRR